MSHKVREKELRLKVVRLDSFEQIQEFNVQWNDLLNSSKDDHVFLTLEWLSSWWKHFGAQRELFLLAVEDKNRILAVAPLMATTYRLFGIQIRRIEFIGTPTSDYHTFILADKSQKCARIILDYVKDCSWDCIELKSIPEDSETASALRVVSKESFDLRERVLDVCPYVPLPATFEEYHQQLHYKMRKNMRRTERNLRKEHRVEFKPHTEMGSLEDAMDAFFKLHQQRWQSKGYSGIFSTQALRDFHLEVAKRFDEKGWLRLYFLTVDDKPVSVEYSFRYKQKLFDYLTGFDPAYSRYGVGNLTLMHAFERTIESGSYEFDFMRGDHAYKDQFNALIRKNIELSAIRRRPVPMVYDWLVRKDALAPLSERLRKHIAWS